MISQVTATVLEMYYDSFTLRGSEKQNDRISFSS